MPIASITLKLELGLGYLLVLPLWIAAIGVLTGRVLGVNIGRWRSAVAAVVGWLAGLIAGALALGPRNLHPLLIIPLSVFFGVLAALPVAIVLDVVTRSRRRRGQVRQVLRHPLRAVRLVLAPVGRFRELVGIARSENLLHVRYRHPAALASPDLARRVRSVLERAGGMFVKFGQIAATRSDLLPETLTSELANLHANVARVPADAVAGVLRDELGEPVEQAFGEFDREPLAAASIGQTHRAKLHDGRAVVVKVQRPGLEEIVLRDSAVLSFVARQLDRRVEAARRIGVRDLAGELITSIEAELDYGLELAAGLRMRESLATNGLVQVPVVHPTLSTGRLLVMDEVLGRSVSDTAAVDAAPVGRSELSRRLLSSFLTQILQDGYYHADPHPGNVLIGADGVLWLLDFGAVGRIDPVARDALQGIAIGFSLREASLLARAVRYLVGDHQIDMRQLERDLAMLLGEVDTGGLSPAAMAGVMEVMEQHGLRPPPSMLLLSRTLITLEGTLKTIDPGFELASEAQLLVTQDHQVQFGSPEELVRKELVRALPALRTLPEHAEELASQARSGRLTVRTERYAGADRSVVETWLNRVLVALAGGAGALTSAALLTAGSLSANKVVRDALWTLGFSGLTGSAVLLMRTAAQALHDQAARTDEAEPTARRV
ncbi:MAG: AarF/UbiB family protein [Actinomycetota bacterium]|nr:AarF/UbiB family protein [Actinomycetota bacterium]